MKKRSKQNNPEQKTRNGVNNNDIIDPVKQAKQAYEQSGGQPQQSKMRVE
jgi:hypothetical protein